MAQTVSTSALSPQSFFQTTLSGNITASDTTIPLNSLPTANEGYIVLESTSSTAREVLHFTSKTGSAVVCGSTGDRGLFGTTAASHSSGALVEDNWVTGYWLDLQSAAALSSSAILQKHLANPTEGQFGNNFVSSGFGLTGVSSSLVATLASGIAYVAGSRVVPSVGGHTYQAQSDTFIDVKSDATLTFAGGTSGNSGASIPLTANSTRVARVNTHATGINSITQTGVDVAGNTLLNRNPYPPTTATAVVTTAESAATQSFGDNLTTTGPTVTVTIGPSGNALVCLYARQASNSTTSGRVLTGFSISGVNTQAAADASAIDYQAYAANSGSACSVVVPVTGLAPGSTTFKMQYRVTSDTGTWSNRRITVMAL